MSSSVAKMEVDDEIVQKTKKEDDDDEMCKLRSIFPEELWLIMFDAVRQPDDLIPWAAAAPYLKALLEPRRTAYMFPKVLKILHQNKYVTRKDCMDLVQLRLVCKKWKLAVDLLLESSTLISNVQCFQLTRHKPEESLAYPAIFRLYKAHILDKLELQIVPAISTAEARRNNPFPSRYIEICNAAAFIEPIDIDVEAAVPLAADPPLAIPHGLPFPVGRELIFHGFPFFPGPDVPLPAAQAPPVPLPAAVPLVDVDRYHDITEKFLSQAGHHFWYAHINMIWEGACPMEWYMMTSRYVGMMPNLKSLYIQCPEFSLREITQFRNLPPFPTLKNLELVSIARPVNSAVNAILAANKTVKAVFIPTTRTERFEHIVQVLQASVAQEQLKISLPQDLHTFSTELVCQREFNDMPSNWKLKVLRLNLANCPDLKNWSSIFIKLEYYKATLAELYIKLPRATTPDEKLIVWESSRSVLHLPFLQKLEIFIGNICCLDFLLGLMSLEYLALYGQYNDRSPPEKGTDARVINFYYDDAQSRCPFHTKNLLDSNIWDVIPTLKKIDFMVNRRSVQPFHRRDRRRPN